MRRGRGFAYTDDSGNRFSDPEELERIRELAIPPAWKDVWICLDRRGHLQATGVDGAGRKQYLYHPLWRTRRDQQKFDQMIEFANALPRMRRIVARDIRKGEMSRDQVLACAVRMLDRGFFRIGSEDYAEQNDSYGLATMRKEHVTVNGEEIEFDYPAKSGRRRVHSIADDDVRGIVSSLKRRRGGGDELLAYRNRGRWRDIASSEINEYVKATTGGDFSAKDFRTWNATVLAAVALALNGSEATSKTSRKRAISAAVKGVAHFLGNTPAVCRASYIDPRVFDRYLSGWTIGGAIAKVKDPANIVDPRPRRLVEEAVLDLITEQKPSQLGKVPELERVAELEKVAA